MKLYYSPTTCATAIHILLLDLDIPHEAINVPHRDLTNPKTMEFRALNPMAHFPVLVLDDGTVLTQMMAIIEYLTRLRPDSNVWPSWSDGAAHVEATRWLSFLAADVHTSFATEYPWTTIWSEEAETRKAREFWEMRLDKRLRILDQLLGEREWITGSYSACDPYLMIIMGWARQTEFDVKRYPNIWNLLLRISKVSSVRKVFEEEGIPLYEE